MSPPVGDAPARTALEARVEEVAADLCCRVAAKGAIGPCCVFLPRNLYSFVLGLGLHACLIEDAVVLLHRCHLFRLDKGIHHKNVLNTRAFVRRFMDVKNKRSSSDCQKHVRLDKQQKATMSIFLFIAETPTGYKSAGQKRGSCADCLARYTGTRNKKAR